MDRDLRKAIGGEAIETLSRNPAGLCIKDIYKSSKLAVDIVAMSSVLVPMRRSGTIERLNDGCYILPCNIDKHSHQSTTTNDSRTNINQDSQKKETNTNKILMSLKAGPMTSEQIADTTSIRINIVWKIVSRLRNQGRIEREERPRKQGNLYSLPDAIPSSDSDPIISDVETCLLKSVRAAQEALDTYLVLVANEDIVKSLRSNRDNARSTLETWRKEHVAA